MSGPGAAVVDRVAPPDLLAQEGMRSGGGREFGGEPVEERQNTHSEPLGIEPALFHCVIVPPAPPLTLDGVGRSGQAYRLLCTDEGLLCRIRKK